MRAQVQLPRVKCSERTNLLGAGSFRTLPSLEGDLLAFVEIVEVGACHCRHMEKQVFSFTGVDESKALVGESFDRSFSHCVLRVSCETRPAEAFA